MKTTKLMGLLLLLIVSTIAFSGTAAAMNATVNFVKVNGDEVFAGSNTIDALDRDNEITIKVQVTTNEDIDNMQIFSSLAGYDHDDEPRDKSDVFDTRAGVTYTKTLHLTLPPRIEVDYYTLNVDVRSRTETISQQYQLLVDAVRHNVVIRDVSIDPMGGVQAGRTLRALVSIKNYGQQDEDDIKIEFRIPELNVAALPDYLDIDGSDSSSESKTSEELYIRIPACTEPGVYQGVVVVTYHDGDKQETEAVPVRVLESGSPACGGSTTPGQTGGQQPTEPEAGKTIITVGSQAQQVTRGEGGAIYPITFTNTGSQTKVYVVSVLGADEWADVRISPLQTITLGAGDSQSVYIYVSAREQVNAGDKVFSVQVQDSAGDIVKQIALSATITDAEESESSDLSAAKLALEIGLGILVILLIILAIVIIYNKSKKDDDEDLEDEVTGQTYY